MPYRWVLIFIVQNLYKFFVFFIVRKNPIMNTTYCVKICIEFIVNFFYLLLYKYRVVVMSSLERASDTVVRLWNVGGTSGIPAVAWNIFYVAFTQILFFLAFKNFHQKGIWRYLIFLILVVKCLATFIIVRWFKGVRPIFEYFWRL